LAQIKPILHVNFSNPVVKGLINLHKKDAELAKSIIEQVYDNALVTAGLMRDVSSFVPRVNKIIGQLMQQEKSTILTP
jgi:HSP90 family molecular chaperone